MRKRIVEVTKVSSSNNAKRYKLGGKNKDKSVTRVMSIGIVSHRLVSVNVN